MKALHDQAGKQAVSYALATNLLFNIDPAATRNGRFDCRVAVLPPDVDSRVGRILWEVARLGVEPGEDSNLRERASKAAWATGGCAMADVAQPGWFIHREGSKGLVDYVLNGGELPRPPRAPETRELVEAELRMWVGKTLKDIDDQTLRDALEKKFDEQVEMELREWREVETRDSSESGEGWLWDELKHSLE